MYICVYVGLLSESARLGSQ